MKTQRARAVRNIELIFYAFYDIIYTFSGRHLVVFFLLPATAGVFLVKGGKYINQRIHTYANQGLGSGAKGYQSPEFQSMKDKGTIPEGTYVARQQSLQEITIYGSTVGLVGVGTWPGGQPSWGKSRIALEASTTTNTYSRGGFYVHGGWTAGSNGCIDLTENMADFTQWLKKHGQDLIVKLSYR